MFLFVSFAKTAEAQEETKSKSSLNIMIGTGLGVYLKDLPTVPDDDIHNLKPVVSAKFYWKPPHRVQLGFETGYYPLYSTTAIQYEGEEPVDAKSQTTALPLMINVDLRVWKDWHIAIGTGPTMLFSSTEFMGDKASSTVLSAANFIISTSYLYPLTDRFCLGGEVSYFYIGKTVDSHLSFKASLSYRLF